MSFFRKISLPIFLSVALCANLMTVKLGAQETIGSITGTVKDASGAAVPGADVQARNVGTNLTIHTKTGGTGTYVISNLPVGNYEVTFTREGFEKETHTEVIVQGGRTSTVDGSLKVGSTSTSVEVTATPLMNQVDTTNG